jgi:hypothetical protein
LQGIIEEHESAWISVDRHRSAMIVMDERESTWISMGPPSARRAACGSAWHSFACILRPILAQKSHTHSSPLARFPPPASRRHQSPAAWCSPDRRITGAMET